MICIVGLGYVGLPLAIAFARKHEVVGFDVNAERISQLNEGHDISGEVDDEEFKAKKIVFTTDPKIISKSRFIVVAVPTPITKAKVPNLEFLKSASRLVGENLAKDSIVVYESTVYPGATEEVCVPILEKSSGLKFGSDFQVGYSPERINPGDKEHTVDKIVKVVSGSDEMSLKKIADTYGSIITAGIHQAPSIKVAEAAKVIENIQRDLNIALMNELSIIFSKLDIHTKDVLEAAGTKWNFHRYHPGLVGGHCIGVDPYYLTYKAQDVGHNPEIILAGRHINESMAKHVSDMVIKGLSASRKCLSSCRVLIMGLTFKENVPDIRNSKAVQLIDELKAYNLHLVACEPLIAPEVIKSNFGIENIPFEQINDSYDCIVIFSPHKRFGELKPQKFKQMMTASPVVVDIKSILDRDEMEKLGISYYSL